MDLVSIVHYPCFCQGAKGTIRGPWGRAPTWRKLLFNGEGNMWLQIVEVPEGDPGFHWIPPSGPWGPLRSSFSIVLTGSPVNLLVKARAFRSPLASAAVGWFWITSLFQWCSPGLHSAHLCVGSSCSLIPVHLCSFPHGCWHGAQTLWKMSRNRRWLTLQKSNWKLSPGHHSSPYSGGWRVHLTRHRPVWHGVMYMMHQECSTVVVLLTDIYWVLAIGQAPCSVFHVGLYHPVPMTPWGMDSLWARV